MSELSLFLVLVFFIYGVAFFIMGFAVALESRRSSGFPLAASLKYLAAFGLIHSLTAWMDMFIIVLALVPGAPDSSVLRVIKVLLLAVSATCLVLFGAKLIGETLKRYFWLYLLPVALFTVWLLSFIIPHAFWITDTSSVPVTELCTQCHRGQAVIYLAAPQEWLTSADIWARYILYLPGSLLAALAMMSQGYFFRTLGLTAITRYCTWAAAAFAFNAVVAGLIVPPGPYFPASVINYASFFSWFGIPPQILRAGAALIITLFVIRILSVFEIERQRQLERANQERFAAQQQALEAQRQAREQLEVWSQELEQRVEERTREIEERDNQLVILGERNRIAAEMHDSLGQVFGYLNLKIISLKQLLDSRQRSRALEALQQMEEAMDNASADVRESILSLKTNLSPDVSFLPALEGYLTKFGDLTGLKTEMVVNGDLTRAFSPLMEVQLLRIVQEALTNIRKHAQATLARVRIEPGGTQTLVTVEDNGLGFDLPTAVQSRGRHFGIRVMEERARDIGGELRIETAPGQGTKVIVRLPRNKEKND